ncbi:MAG: hypothetical protein KF852_19265 [Saprospiraceae bacterium]|nr:hypothetical protein [Saprospiraceae bacterium]
MNADQALKMQFLATVEEQLKSGRPAETTATLQRLVAEGYSAENARLLIAQCVAVEYISSIENDTPFNQERFVKNLEEL